jgi:hypothetical protein
MLCHKSRVFFLSLVLFEFSAGLLKNSFCFMQFIMILFFDFLLGFQVSFVVSDSFVEGFHCEAALHPEGEASKRSKPRKHKEVNLLISLNLRNV